MLLYFCGTRAFKRNDIPWRKKKYTNLLDLFIWFTGLVHSVSLAFICDVCGLGVVLVQLLNTRTTLLRLTPLLSLPLFRDRPHHDPPRVEDITLELYNGRG